MATGQAIREELVHWGLIALLGSATANAGAVAQITDITRLQSTSWASSVFDDSWVRLTSEDDGVNARDGSQSKVDYLDSVNGILNVSPNWEAGSSDTVHQTGNTYEIWKPGVDPDDVDRARDRALTTICSQWYYHPLSMIPNAAYVDDLGATNWELINSATIAKQTLSFPDEFARDSLLVSGGGVADGAAESASMYVRPSTHFYLWVPVSCRTGTGEVIVYDVTNSAEISLSGTPTQTLRGWSAIEVSGQAPSGCGEITVRLTAQGTNDIIEWGPVHFHWTNQKVMSLPDRVDTRTHVGPIHRLINAPTAGTEEVWGSEDMEEVPGVRTQQISNNVRIRMDNYVLPHSPLFYEERIFYAALGTGGYLSSANRRTGDAASTLCDTDYVVPAMVKLLAEQYRIKQPWATDFWDGLLGQAEQELAVKEREYGPTPKPHLERYRAIRVPNLKV